MADTRLFGTDGIRGEANRPPMTTEMIMAVGRAVAMHFRKEDGTPPRVVVGRDTRLSGPMLECALAAGICSAGGDVFLAGILPTPGVAFLTRDIDAGAGVAISASHNPYRDNGIKIFSSRGRKLSDAEEDAIEVSISLALCGSPAVTGGEVGAIHEIGVEARSRYAAFCMRAFPGPSLEDLHLVLDCAHGATYQVAPPVFQDLGARVTIINAEPNGLNINEGCGSEHPEGLSAKVREVGADVGLAFDGDGDRLIAVDENGVRLTGDQIIATCARMYKEQGWLDNDLVVTTVMSNFGLGPALRRLGIDHVTSKVGDRYVLELMGERQAALGGEDSGHIIFSRHHTTGDGIVAALQLLAAVRFYHRPLSELACTMVVSPQTVVNVDVVAKPPLDDIRGLGAAMAEAEAELGEQGRVLIRYSGTQAMCRVMVEGPTSEMTDRLAHRLAGVIRGQIDGR
jgi:phosphoglucosamine mutase